MLWILGSAVLGAFIYFCLLRPMAHWSRKGVKQKFILKQWVDILRATLQLTIHAEMVVEVYNQFPGARYSGGYQFLKPVLFLRDPDLIKQLTVKDFDHFLDHGSFIPEDMEPLWGKNLFALKGWYHLIV